MSTRVRLVGFHVKPAVMLDDDENLEGIDVAPVFVTAAKWDEWQPAPRTGSSNRSAPR